MAAALFLCCGIGLSAPVSPAGRGDLIRKETEACRYDSASHLLQAAWAAGLPEDSLYYLWAGIYLARGAPDTALALNIAGMRAGTENLTVPLLEQRYAIYATLGWVREAREVLDSIRASLTPAPGAAPRISIDSWTGANQRNTIEGQPFPFINTSPVYIRITNPAQDISLSSSWFFPLAGGTVLAPAIRYAFTNGIEQTDFSVDSLNHSFGLSLDANNLWRTFSLSLSLNRRISIFREYSTQSTAMLSRGAPGEHWHSYSSLMYSIESAKDTAIAYQCFWFLHYLGRKLSPSADLALLPLLSCFLTDDLRSSYDASVMFIEDPSAAPVMHYTDATCTQAIPIPSPLDMISEMRLLTAYRNAAAAQTFALTAPESYCGFNPSIRLTFRLPRGFSIEGAVKGMAYYYLKEHEWTTFSVPSSATLYGGGAWLAYSRSDGCYYLVQELGNIRTAEKYSGPLAISHEKKRRIDYAAGGEAGIEWRLTKNATLRINGYVTKYRSTLQNDGPVEMKDLLYGAGIGLRAGFGAAEPALAY